jgi:signal transduction histidine kinase
MAAPAEGNSNRRRRQARRALGDSERPRIRRFETRDRDAVKEIERVCIYSTHENVSNEAFRDRYDVRMMERVQGVKGRMPDWLTETLTGLRNCRLCWRITLTIFLAILLTEAAILFFSVQRFEADRLREIEREGIVVTRAILRAAAARDEFPAAIAEVGPVLRRGSVLLGITVKDGGGAVIGGFGKRAEALDTPVGAASVDRRDPDGDHWDRAWSRAVTRSDFDVVARLDISEISSRLDAFIWRIVGLVLLVSVVVTIVTMVVLERLILRPVRQLNDGLTATALDPGNPLVHELTARGTDELREMTESFDLLTRRLSEAFEALARSNDELRVKEKAEESNRVKTEFLANMSHDLRTPLNAIIGFSQMMKSETLGPIGNPKYAEYSADVLAAGEHLSSLVERLLDVSRIERDELALDEKWLDVAEVVQRSNALRVARLEAAGDWTVRIDIPDGAPKLFADQTALIQILDNLVNNSREHAGPACTTTIHWGESDGGQGALTISDNGRGIAPDQLGGILEPYRQGDSEFHRSSTLARLARGFGLGLHIVRKLADAHQAVPRIESRLGQGARFTILFPPARVRR